MQQGVVRPRTSMGFLERSTSMKRLSTSSGKGGRPAASLSPPQLRPISFPRENLRALLSHSFSLDDLATPASDSTFTPNAPLYKKQRASMGAKYPIQQQNRGSSSFSLESDAGKPSPISPLGSRSPQQRARECEPIFQPAASPRQATQPSPRGGTGSPMNMSPRSPRRSPKSPPRDDTRRGSFFGHHQQQQTAYLQKQESSSRRGSRDGVIPDRPISPNVPTAWAEPLNWRSKIRSGVSNESSVDGDSVSSAGEELLLNEEDAAKRLASERMMFEYLQLYADKQRLKSSYLKQEMSPRTYRARMNSTAQSFTNRYSDSVDASRAELAAKARAILVSMPPSPTRRSP